MNQKPLITIDKFSGAGQNGILFCEGFYPDVINQKSVMAEGLYTYPIFDSTTTGFSKLVHNSLYSALSTFLLTDANVSYNLYIDGGITQRIYAYEPSFRNKIKAGQIHASSTNNFCAKPDILETLNGNILFPSARYIGRGVRFTATGGSTTTIIDTTRNFVTLGYANGDKVTNLKTGIEYTITSISTTTNTNDTLNFTASGTNTTGSGDECIAWEDDRFDTNIKKAVWQSNQTQWVKQFETYGVWYLFTNGNYIGSISSDESTVDATYKQLPAKHQALAINANNEKILVSANASGKGALLLWDGHTDGWNNILKLDVPVYAITEYQSGWVYVSQGGVFYTDGYQKQKLYDMNNTKLFSSRSLSANTHNGLAINQGKLLVSHSGDNSSLSIPGIYMLDLDNVSNGFTLIKPIKKGRLNGVPTGLFLSNRFTQYQPIEVLGDFSCYIYYGAPSATYNDKSIILSVSLPNPMRITGIGLNLSRYDKDYDNYNTDDYRKVGVSIGNGNRGIITLANPKADGTSSVFTVNGEFYRNNEVGDEIFYYREGAVKNLYGERTFIKSIDDKDTATETWTVEPAFSDTVESGADFRMIRVKKLDIKNIGFDDLAEEIMFYNPNTGVLSNKVYIEIVFYGHTNAMPLNINEIKVYGD